MKKHFLYTISICLLFFAGLTNTYAQKDGATCETLTLPTFTTINAENIVRVILKQGDKQEIIKEVTNGYEDKVFVEVKNGTLKTYARDLFNNKENNQNNFVCNVYVTVPSIENIKLENAASLKVENTLKCTKPLAIQLDNASAMKGNIEGGEIKVSTQNASKFECNIVADNVTLKAENASKIVVSGKVKTATCVAQNVSKIDAEGLSAETSSVESNSLSKINAPSKNK